MVVYKRNGNYGTDRNSVKKQLTEMVNDVLTETHLKAGDLFRIRLQHEMRLLVVISVKFKR